MLYRRDIFMLTIVMAMVNSGFALPLTFNYIIQPYGIRMCEAFCHSIKDCSSFLFSTTDIACQVTNTEISKQSFVIHQLKEIRNRDIVFAECCPRCHMIILTRTKMSQCVRSNDGDTPAGEVMPSQLLYGEVHKGPVRRYFFTNKTVLPYSAQNVSSMAFIASSRRFIIGVWMPRGKKRLISQSLDGGDRQTMVEDEAPLCISVDQEKQLIFIGDVGYIKRMEPDGSRIESLLTSKDYAVVQIALYTQRLIIFASTRSKIISVTYKGQDEKEVYSGSSVNAVTIDHDDNVLYYSDFNEIFQKSLKHNTSEVIKISRNPKRMLYYGRNIFISYSGSFNIIGLLKDKVLNEHFLTLDFKEEVTRGVFICVIP